MISFPDRAKMIEKAQNLATAIACELINVRVVKLSNDWHRPVIFLNERLILVVDNFEDENLVLITNDISPYAPITRRVAIDETINISDVDKIKQIVVDYCARQISAM